MFTPKTPKIAGIAKASSKVIAELEGLLTGNVYMYIDYANVRPWSTKLKWHIDLKRLKQFLDSFDVIQEIKFYHGTLEGSESSEQEINTAKAGKKVLIFATARRIARELDKLTSDGLIVFDIQKIREFICWNREVSSHLAKEPPKKENSKP